MVNRSEAVMYGPVPFLEYTTRLDFVDKFGQTEMHIMKECYLDYPIAFVLQKDSLYTEALGKKIQQVQVCIFF